MQAQSHCLHHDGLCPRYVQAIAPCNNHTSLTLWSNVVLAEN